MVIAVGFQLFHPVEVEVGGLVGGGQPLGGFAAEGRVRLDLQEIGGDVVCAPLFQQSQGIIELGLCIIRESHHNIPADPLEPCPRRIGQSLAGLAGGVGAAQTAELVVPGGLDPEGDPVDPRGPVGRQGIVVHRLGVCLQGDLRPGGGLGGLDQPGYRRRVQQAGGAPAEINGVGVQGLAPGVAGQLPQKGVRIFRRNPPGPRPGVKVTVPALGKTVGNMQI